MRDRSWHVGVRPIRRPQNISDMKYPNRSLPRRSHAPITVRQALALLGSGGKYWSSIYPQVRRELRRWERAAGAIPDPYLRRAAVSKLTEERLNPEGAALFAVLAPRARRAQVVRLIVAFQILYDYLDAVNEEHGATELQNGMQLHRALVEAVQPRLPLSEHYRHHRTDADGGYTRSLTHACREIVRDLPAGDRTSHVLARAAARCGTAQSHNHAVNTGGQAMLIRWCSRHRSGTEAYLWWELAAGGISCLGVHALMASVADDRCGLEEAEQIDAAYFPPICAISALLDSLADYHGDLRTGNHSFVAHYRDGVHAAERLLAIAAEATERIGALHNRVHHAVILAGICSFYLSSSTMRSGFPAIPAARLVEAEGAIGTATRTVMRSRRALKAVAARTRTERR